MQQREKGYVLACQTTVHGDVEVEVPEESRLDLDKISEQDLKLLRLKGIYSQAVDVDKGKGVIKEDLFVHSPLATKLYLELPRPTLSDTASDLERLYREIRKIRDIPIMQTGLTNIKRLGRLFREKSSLASFKFKNRSKFTSDHISKSSNYSPKNHLQHVVRFE